MQVSDFIEEQTIAVKALKLIIKKVYDALSYTQNALQNRVALGLDNHYKNPVINIEHLDKKFGINLVDDFLKEFNAQLLRTNTENTTTLIHRVRRTHQLELIEI